MSNFQSLMSKSALRFLFNSSNHEVRQLLIIFSRKTTFFLNFKYFKIIETEKKFHIWIPHEILLIWAPSHFWFHKIFGIFIKINTAYCTVYSVHYTHITVSIQWCLEFKNCRWKVGEKTQYLQYKHSYILKTSSLGFKK